MSLITVVMSKSQNIITFRRLFEGQWPITDAKLRNEANSNKKKYFYIFE